MSISALVVVLIIVVLLRGIVVVVPGVSRAGRHVRA